MQRPSTEFAEAHFLAENLTEEAIGNGAKGFLLEPFRQEELSAVVRRVLRIIGGIKAHLCKEKRHAWNGVPHFSHVPRILGRFLRPNLCPSCPLSCCDSLTGGYG